MLTNDGPVIVVFADSLEQMMDFAEALWNESNRVATADEK
jgi:hypothetical protein